MDILLPSARAAAIRINGQSVGKEIMLGPLVAGILKLLSGRSYRGADS